MLNRFTFPVFCGLLVGSTASAATPAAERDRSAAGFMTIKNRQFYDAAGRNVILRGINIGFSCGPRRHRQKDAPWRHGGPEAFVRIKQWGYACVRFVIFWSAVEPECGRYDEAFLRRMDERIGWAKANGIRVIIDMHQDLWGQGASHGRGAPEWALVDKDKPHVKGEKVWSEAYFRSPVIQTAFDNFWKNAPAPDGVGIQDHFAMAWQHVAKRYADDPMVVGYDLFNEPFVGTAVSKAMIAMTLKMTPRLLAKGIDTTDLDLFELASKAMALAETNIELYREWLSAGDKIMPELERTRVGAMYQRVARAIRKVDGRHFILTSPTLTANFGVANGIPNLLDQAGKRDPGHVFAPHAYDDDIQRIELILGRLIASAKRLDTPMLLGEWGNLTNSDKIFQSDPVPPTQVVVKMLDEAKASDTYWYYMDRLDKQPYFKSVLQRPYPMCAAGEILGYRFCPETSVFECSWREDPSVKMPSVIYVPSVWYAKGHSYELTPPGAGARFKTITPDTKNGCLTIPSMGKVGERRLVLRPKGE